MRELYADLDRRVAEHAPTCWNKGECCRFGRYGHRLYVTSLEVAYYLAMGPGREPSDSGLGSPAAAALLAEATCPHAFGGSCHARDRRPVGCRVFYCDPASQDWQGPVTEEFLGRLRAMHEGLSVPYVYADWLVVLAALRGEW